MDSQLLLNQLLLRWLLGIGCFRFGVYTWGIHVLGYTRGGVYMWVGTGTFLPRAKKIKIKDFQSCLLTLPAYFPLKLPDGQFPPKIPGPVSQTKLKTKKQKQKLWRRCGFNK